MLPCCGAAWLCGCALARTSMSSTSQAVDIVAGEKTLDSQASPLENFMKIIAKLYGSHAHGAQGRTFVAYSPWHISIESVPVIAALCAVPGRQRGRMGCISRMRLRRS